MKKCARCGEVKPLSEFRSYYNRKTGVYSYCKTCEKIEARRKYLLRKANLTTADRDELEKIEALYAHRAKAGLAVPGVKYVTNSTLSIVEAQLEALK